MLVPREGHRYSSLGEAIAWESDSKRLAVLATRPNFIELVLVSIPRGEVVSELADPSAAKDRVKETVADVVLEPQRGFASCRGQGQLSWGEGGIYFSIIPNVSGSVAKQASLQLWVPAASGGVKVAPLLSRDFAWKSASVEGNGMWYLAVSEH